MVGWSIYGVAIEQIFARFFVLSVAFVGGATIGSTVGVITGFILSLALMTNVYEVSLLAFSGLLGGLLKDGTKIDRKSTRLNSSHVASSYAVFCLKKTN